MRSHDGYRALVVFATVLVYMHGTLAVRIAGSASRRNGESSSLLWFSRASFRLALPYLTSVSPVILFRFRYLRPVLLFFRCEPTPST